MKKNKGFTLLEVAITMGILGIILGVFTTFYSSEIRLYYSKNNEIELKQDARIAIDRIVNKIRTNNGLTYMPGIDGTGVVYKDTNILINTTKNDANGEINYIFDEAKGYGEIRDSSGNRYVNNIKEFKIEKQDIAGTEGLLRITIVCWNDKSNTEKKYTTAVRLRTLSGL